MTRLIRLVKGVWGTTPARRGYPYDLSTSPFPMNDARRKVHADSLRTAIPYTPHRRLGA